MSLDKESHLVRLIDGLKTVNSPQSAKTIIETYFNTREVYGIVKSGDKIIDVFSDQHCKFIRLHTSLKRTTVCGPTFIKKINTYQKPVCFVIKNVNGRLSTTPNSASTQDAALLFKFHERVPFVY